MRYYADTKIWRKCVALKEEIFRMCDIYDWHEMTIADYKETATILCDSIRDAFGMLDEDGVACCLIVAGGKVGRLTGFLEVDLAFDIVEREKVAKIFFELCEINDMISVMIQEINDEFWFEGAFD